MNCTWCDQEAIRAGKRPSRTTGPDYLYSCEAHKRLIEHLGYIEIDLNEIISEQRRQEVLQKRTR